MTDKIVPLIVIGLITAMIVMAFWTQGDRTDYGAESEDKPELDGETKLAEAEWCLPFYSNRNPIDSLNVDDDGNKYDKVKIRLAND